MTLAAIALGAGLFPQGLLARWAESRLQAAVGPGCRIGQLRLVPGLLTAEAADVLIETDTLRLLLRRVRVRVAPETLFRRRLVLASLSADYADLSLNLSSRTAATPKMPAVPPIVARHVQIESGRVVVKRDARERLRLSGVAVHGSAGVGTLSVKVNDAVLSGRKLGSLSAQVALSPQLELSLQRTTLETPASRLELSGGLRRAPDGLRWDLAARGHVGLADILPHQGAGQLSLTAEATGSAEAIGDADVRVEATHLALRGMRIDRLSARLSRAAGRTAIAEAHATSGPARADLHARLADDHIQAAISLANMPLAGLLSTRARGTLAEAAGVSGSLTASGDLRRALEVGGQLTAHVDVPSAPEWITHADVAGTLTPRTGALNAHFQATAQTGRVPTGSPLASARLDLAGDSSGPWPPRLEATATGTAALALPGGPSEVSFRATRLLYSRAGLEAELEADVLGGHMTATGAVDPREQVRLAVGATGLDLASLAPGLRGQAALQLRASGPSRRLAHHAQIAVAGARWDNVKLETLTLSSDGVGQQAHVTLTAPALSLSGTGDLNLQRRPALTATILLAHSPLEPLGAWLASPLAGNVSGRVDLHVPLGDLRGTAISSRIDAGTASYERTSIAIEQPFLFSYDARSVRLDDFAASGSGLRISGHARYDRGASRLDLQATFGGDLSRLPTPADWSLSGQAAGDITLSGSITHPTGRGSLLLNDARAQTPVAPEIAIAAGRVDLAGTDAQLDIPSVELLGGSLTATGRIPLSAVTAPHSDIDAGALDLRWQGIDVARLSAWLRPQRATPLRGTLAGSGHVENPFSPWPRLRATVHLLETPLASDEASFVLAPLTLELADGRVRADALTLRSDAGTLTARGTLDLRQRQLAMALSGNGDLRALSPFLGSAAVAGTAALDLDVQGPLAQPTWSGSLGVSNGSLRLREFRQSLTDVNAHLTFDGRRIVLQDLTGALGGGTLSGKGEAELRAFTIAGLNVSLTADDVGLIYPEGLRTRLDGALTLAGRANSYLLSGQLRASRGLYDQNLATENAFTPAPPPAVSPALRAIRLELDVATTAPLLVRNDIARLDAQGRLSLRGDMEVPRPYGRFDLLAGGHLYLQGSDFTIESGSLSYDGTWTPAVTLTATTTVDFVESPGAAQQTRKITVTAEASGTAAELTNAWAARLAGNADTSLDSRLHLSSSEGLSQAQLAACLLGSCGGSSTPGVEARFVGEQAATLLAGQLATRASRTLQALGIEEVRIQPELIARVSNPGARFTFAKRLGPDVRLIVSRGLQSAEESFFELEARPGHDTNLSVQRLDSGEYIAGAGQRMSLGRRRLPTTREAPETVSSLRIENGPAALAARLTAAGGVRTGSRVTFWKLQEASDRMRALLVREHYIEAEVSARLSQGEAVFSVRAGPHFAAAVSGMTKPPDLWPTLLRALHEEEALARGRVKLLRALYARRHYHARVRATAHNEGPNRALSFQVEPGPRLHECALAFPGTQAIDDRRLRQAAGSPADIVAQPEQAVSRIQALYRRERFLSARVSQPVVTETALGLTVEIAVNEGPRARIVSIAFSGSQEPTPQLQRLADVPAGQLYDDALILAGMERLRTHFLIRGYTDVRVSPKVTISQGNVAVLFEIDPGTRYVAGELDIRGATTHLANRIRRTAPIKPGQPVDAVALARYERRLLTMASLARADVRQGPGNPAPIIVEVEPAPRVQLGYDLSYGQREHLGGLLDAELRDVGGLVTLGARYRVAADTREVRGSVHAPGSGLTASVFRLNEPPPAVTLTNPRVQSGVELQQSFRAPAKSQLLLGYRFKRVTIGQAAPTNVGAIDLTLVRETRDNPLDSHHGALLSLNLELARPWLASQSSFVKGYAQVLVATPIGRRLVWAQGARLGLAYTSSDEPLLASERFTAGGATSLRAFATDAIGPKDLAGTPAGGQALFVVNQELRYMGPSHLGLAVFYDVGNVFARPRDFRLSARQDAGIGLRWLSPVGLLRLDLAAPLARRPGERRLRPFFSLGQAF